MSEDAGSPEDAGVPEDFGSPEDAGVSEDCGVQDIVRTTQSNPARRVQRGDVKWRIGRILSLSEKRSLLPRQDDG